MKATVTAHAAYTVADVDPRLYGAFLEHLGRAVYTGIHEPGHPTADAEGMRGDVLDLVRELAPPVVRYPGGNFVSAYNWEDGIGPVADRPRRLDLAWRTTEPNLVGIHEFADWAQKAGTEMMLAVNLGSRGLDAARAFVEYVNHPGGTHWSDLRRRNGAEKPWNCRLWCLGNEMDGPWQVGHKTAEEYGHLANETAKALRGLDPALELVVCGSSHSQMPTYPQWEATVLEATCEQVDHISLHMYFENHEHDTAEFLALSERLDRYIGTVSGVIDYVRAKRRSRRPITISFDEWNVWYHEREADAERMRTWDWPEAPRLLEDIYTFEDVLMVGGILNTFLRRADVVRIACIAQLVNVIAPIMTEPGGPAWRQTIFWPLLFASRHGRGTSLRLAVEVPTYGAAAGERIPWLDVAGVLDADGGWITLFAVNRHATETIEAAVALEGFAPRGVEHTLIRHPDLMARNTLEAPDTVRPETGDGARIDGRGLALALPPHSYSMVRVRL